MNLHEHQAKALLRGYGIKMLDGVQVRRRRRRRKRRGIWEAGPGR